MDFVIACSWTDPITSPAITPIMVTSQTPRGRAVSPRMTNQRGPGHYRRLKTMTCSNEDPLASTPDTVAVRTVASPDTS